jgi:hypothetical protein
MHDGMMRRLIIRIGIFDASLSVCVALAATLAGCGKDKPAAPPAAGADLCVEKTYSAASGSTGNAQVFVPDPLSSSGNINLVPTASHLDDFRAPVTLSHLGGLGILKGNYVEVKSGLPCSTNYVFNAYDPANNFSYSHGDPRFQEAMAYYFGDIYRTEIDSAGYLQSRSPVEIWAHCEKADNSFFLRVADGSGNSVEAVCLGDSVTTPGASYGDDAVVTMHELQHATTADNYSPSVDLNQFFYDEAGAMNEAISDFMSMMYADSLNTNPAVLDARIFSRWALGTFDPNGSHIRGTHRCPVYDSSFPSCGRFPAFGVPSVAAVLNSVSYTYPDGVGWPYTSDYKGSPSAAQVFLNYRQQEEIHNVGIILAGALWDVYSGVKNNHPGNWSLVSKAITQLVMESVAHLPQPDGNNRSPVTFIKLAANMMAFAPKIPDFTPADLTAIQQALMARQLYGMPTINSDWLAIGTGTSNQITNAPNMGDPQVLQMWIGSINGGIKNPPQIPQTIQTGLNNQLDPGEIDAIWFDLKNTSKITAGGVLLTVTTTDPEVTILDGRYNIGYVPTASGNGAQIMYAKVNGTDIVTALSPDGSAAAVPTGNSYFKTNLYFNKNYRTAIWVAVSPQAAHGKEVHFQVDATPANGITSTKVFKVIIN